MTIFLKIIRDYLTNELTDYIGTSSSSDKSVINYLSQTLYAGREKQLSNQKRAIASELIQELKTFKLPELALPKEDSSEGEGANKDNDLDVENDKGKEKEVAELAEEVKLPTTSNASDTSIATEIAQPSQDYLNTNQIISLLLAAKAAAKKESDALNYDEGTFGPLIIDMIKVINNFLGKLKDMQLQDIPDDNDPYNKLCYYLATYLFKNTLGELHPSALARITTNPKITNSRKLTREKELLVKERIIACKEDLETLDIHHTKYHQTRRSRVLAHIHELKELNQGKVNEYGLNITIPITLAFFSTLKINGPKLGPEAGMLNDCLTEAQNAIKKENLEHVVEQISSVTLT
ncbi:coiled-coil protein [Legionella beliardensis]|uniref:Coiled-coil protein n=1 Tax=Legionella beliardensis TaxID=91822 RepID=A0A378I4U5_9GAMM|nr:hypothetical protein [Legionella beliardensis]STX30218.1 coiled-coil protein [Legionella beliardensis]